jgi:putative oxidoreductase
MNKFLATQSLNTDLASLFLRLVVGCLFFHYGYQKFMSFDEYLPKFPDLIGIGSKLSFILVIFAELVCGFFVAIGLLTRLSIIPIFITMTIAYFLAHATDPFQAKTLPFVYLILCVVIFILGSGRYSVDAMLKKS